MAGVKIAWHTGFAVGGFFSSCSRRGGEGKGREEEEEKEEEEEQEGKEEKKKRKKCGIAFLHIAACSSLWPLFIFGTDAGRWGDCIKRCSAALMWRGRA